MKSPFCLLQDSIRPVTTIVGFLFLAIPRLKIRNRGILVEYLTWTRVQRKNKATFTPNKRPWDNNATR